MERNFHIFKLTTSNLSSIPNIKNKEYNKKVQGIYHLAQVC